MRDLLQTTLISMIVATVAAVTVIVLIDGRLAEERELREDLASELHALRLELALASEQRRSGPQASDQASLRAELTQPQPTESPEALRAFVLDVVEEARLERDDQARRSLWTRMREQQQDGTGPYGRFNRRVNAMTRTLGLDYSQASYYHELLEDYDERAGALYSDVGAAATSVTALSQLMRSADGERTALDAEFDRAFTQLLEADQAERYAALPSEQRGVGPSAGLSRLQVDLDLLSPLSAEDA